MKKQFTLGKEERIKSRKQIEHLFEKGRSFAHFPFRVYHDRGTVETQGENPPAALRFGVGVSSRHFRKAVDRNRIKRLVREAWRLQKNELQGLLKEKEDHLHVFLIYTGKEIPDFTLIREKVAGVFVKLNKILHENTGTNP